MIPEGWLDQPIGDIANVVAGGTPTAGNPDNFAAPGSEVAWLTPADLSKYKSKFISHGARDLTQEGYNSSSAKLMPKGSLLFSSRAPIGYVVIAANPICTNQGFKNFVFTEQVDSTYAFYYLKSIRDLAESLGSGTTFKELSGATAKTIPFRLAPLAEQKVIADKLDELLVQVESTKARLDAIPAILKSFRQSVLAAAVSGKLTEEWREGMQLPANNNDALRNKIYNAWLEARNAEFDRKGKQPKTQTWLTKFSEPQFIKSASLSWISLSLENIAEVVDPNPSHRMPKYVTDGIPFISSENIQTINKLDFNKGKKITNEELVKQKTRYEITDGTFAFTRIGTIGKSVLLPSPHEYGISHAMAVVTPYKTIIDSSFLILTMNCTTILKQATDGIQSVGVPDLGIGKMKGFKIPVPTLVEQTEIVRRVEELFALADKVEAQVNAAQLRVNNLTQSILAKAFRGELTADWRAANPELISGENSAEALLKRIKAEREALSVKKKPAKKAKA
ncbi:restriction endonuclease subunit S [Shewanella sp. AC91-MNA-CIBAN-0169]|uniref:restriction endonuclease subunit S n=1 Tax=Shewanella sp. AC91-MNA-CIBAN-0169 TaxID=3140466 RepID=UPI00332C0D3C